MRDNDAKPILWPASFGRRERPSERKVSGSSDSPEEVLAGKQTAAISGAPATGAQSAGRKYCAD